MNKPVRLIMITTANNNKYYNMFDNGDGTFTVKYGRVGASEQTRSYSISQWNKKYNEKINKGYQDVTNLQEDLIEKEEKKKDNTYREIQNKVISELVDKLQSLARATVSENYKVKANAVTQKMVDTAQELLDSLVDFKGTVDEFNEQLIKLFTIIPRKMGNVNEYLIRDIDDIQHKIIEEADILDTMRGQVYVKDLSNKDEENDIPQNDMTILEALGLEIEEVTDSEVNMIKNLMGQNSDKFVKAYKAKHIVSNKKFEEYKKEKNITNTELLWHGSRNRNWFSIMSQSLKIRPAGVATNGSLFGSEGIYFANNVMKSRNYCGLRGSYWVSGNDDTGYVALFETAYGDNPYDVYSFSSEYYNMNEKRLNEKKKGATCLHAHAGTKLDGSWSQLVNDEIIFYNENAVTIRYLVEIK